jgi:hypothetical protein
MLLSNTVMASRSAKDVGLILVLCLQGQAWQAGLGITLVQPWSLVSVLAQHTT